MDDQMQDIQPESQDQPQEASQDQPQEESQDQPQEGSPFQGEDQEMGAAAPADETPAAPVDAQPSGEFQDKTIACVDCGAEFIHAADAQAFYKEKGFANNPKRCPACRRTRKTSRGGGGGGGRGGPREMHPATCSDCGIETQVPFNPTGDRPVYCRDCYMKRRESGQS